MAKRYMALVDGEDIGCGLISIDEIYSLTSWCTDDHLVVAEIDTSSFPATAHDVTETVASRFWLEHAPDVMGDIANGSDTNEMWGPFQRFYGAEMDARAAEVDRFHGVAA